MRSKLKAGLLLLNGCMCCYVAGALLASDRAGAAQSENCCTYSGFVTDQGLAAIPGASVTVKGTPTHGTTTDMNGGYSLCLNQYPVTLVFTCVGYVTQEVQVCSCGGYNVTMTEDVSARPNGDSDSES